RGLAHHAGGGRRLRAGLQRSGRRGGGEPAGRCCRCGSGAERQAAARTDAGQDRGFARTTGRGRNAFGGRRLFQRGECQGLPACRTRTADRNGPSAASSPAWRALRKGGAPPENPTPVEAMAHRLKTPEGRKLYALRKQTPEPVFGVIKSALGFRQFSLRGLDKVRGEWSLVTMAWNLKRMFVLTPA